VVRTQRLYYGWRIALALAVTETVSWGIVYYSFSVFLLPMQADLGATRAQVSGAFSVALLISGIAAIPVGRWIDQHGARGLMTAGSLVGALLLWAWSRTTSLAALYFVFAGLGVVMAALLYDAAFTVITAWFSRRRSHALLLVTLMAGLASTIFVPLSSWLLLRMDWRHALVWLALTLLAITVPLHAFVLRRRPQDLALTIDGGPLVSETELAVSSAQPDSRPRTVLGNPSFWLMTTAFVMSSAVSVGVGVHFIPFLVEQGQSGLWAASLAGAIGLMQLPGRVLFAPLGRLLPRRWLTLGALAMQGVALLLLLGTPGVVPLIAFVTLFGMANGMLTLAQVASVADLYGSTHYGSVNGVMAFWITLAGAAAPTAIALLYSSIYHYELALGVMAAMTIVGTLAYFIAEREAARPQIDTGAADVAPA
jgi:MFS family permease